MKNNLDWLITKAGLTKIEFGHELFPEMESLSHSGKTTIRQKVDRMCKQNAKIPIQLLDPMSKILDADFNEMFGYSKLKQS